MKLSIISDTHLGHPNCSLVTKRNGKYHTTPYYEAFRKAIPEDNEYLLLLGDIIEFGESKRTEAYDAATCFFSQVKKDALATKKIIYVPGNHDFNFWQTIEQQKTIINPIKDGSEPQGFKWSLPCILDDRGTDSKLIDHRDNTPYSSTFLNNLTEPASDFLIAYPNVYLLTGEGSTILITHGQYFEPFWSILGEFVANIAYDDLGKQYGASLDINEFVSLNAPFNTLGSSGAGQAGALSQIIHTVKTDYGKKDIKKITLYMKRSARSICQKMAWYNPLRYLFFPPLLAGGIWYISSKLKDGYDARFDEKFMKREAVHKRVENYFQASLMELESIASTLQSSEKIQTPSDLIFGHTHQPISWHETNTSLIVAGKPVTLHNTGGWLYHPDKNSEKKFPGANIFHYSSSQGMGSHTIEQL